MGAAYGLAALVGGKMAAKAGLFAKPSGLLVAFNKVIPIVVIAAAGLLARLFRRRKARPTVYSEGNARRAESSPRSPVVTGVSNK